MILDVGGRRHKVLESNFNIFPNTRLGKLVRAKTEEDILSLCDGYLDGDIPEYFFDRNWTSFNSILDIYRTGVLHLSTDLCALVLQKDLEYWQIDELILGKSLFWFSILADIWIAISRALLRTQILSRNRNLRQRTEGRAGSKKKGSSTS